LSPVFEHSPQCYPQLLWKNYFSFMSEIRHAVEVHYSPKSAIIPSMKNRDQSHPYTAVVQTPLGKIGVVTKDGKLRAVDFISGRRSEQGVADPLAGKVVQQLHAYFEDAGSAFRLPLELEGTEFQKAVWNQLRKIPPGRVRTYGDIARVLNSSPRAVGNACRANPLPVIVPCHRVVSSQGIGGYGGAVRGGRLQKKRWLLSHEGVSL
jgi:methylated-DNA-[protein]-cysteine S-methyltransferase